MQGSFPTGTERPPQEGDEPSPRAFAVGTGLVLIAVGTALLLGSCCLWSLSGFWIRPDDGGGGAALSPPSDDRTAALLGASCTIVSLVGGIALLAAGVGLFGERPSSGPLGFFVAMAMAFLYAGLSFVALMARYGWIDVLIPAVWSSGPLPANRPLRHGWIEILIPLVLSLVMLAMMALTAVSWQALRRFPPPADLNAVTERDLLNLKQRRRE